MIEDSVPPPLFRLVCEEGRHALLVADGIRGFFVEAVRGESGRVFFTGVPSTYLLISGDLADVELDVVDFKNKVIGKYYIGRAWIGVSQASSHMPGLLDVEASFYGYRCPYPNAVTIWRRWASKKPLDRGEWLHYPVGFHVSWLHVVQNSWFESGRGVVDRVIDDSLSLDGSAMPSVASFYCALGEAVNGAGGYFGSNLDGLADCLSVARGIGFQARVVWSNHSLSMATLGEEFVGSVAGLMEEFDIEVILC